MKSIRDLVGKLYPLPRELVSDGMDEALKIIGDHHPIDARYRVESFAPDLSVWTWKVPKRYVVHEGYLELDDGERLVDYRNNPLHVMSYSISVDEEMTWEDLEPHLFYKPIYSKSMDAIPWEFSYYRPKWGFCISRNQYERLPRDRQYRVVIKSEFRANAEEGLKVGVAEVNAAGPAKSAGEIVICAHTCHPCQANDDVAGAAVAVEVAHRLIQKPLQESDMSVRFLYVPETIGTIAYLSQNEDLIERMKAGIFIEMPGNLNKILYQRSWQANHDIDRITEYVLKKFTPDYRVAEFREELSNDEVVMNGPGVNIPSVSLMRWPYPEYHTSEDNMDIIHESMLAEMADVVEEIVRICATNYIPKRKFRGPVFLTAYDLWVDWRKDLGKNLALDKMMMMFDGRHTIFDIAEKVNRDYWEVHDLAGKFRSNDLIDAMPIPRISYE